MYELITFSGLENESQQKKELNFFHTKFFRGDVPYESDAILSPVDLHM